MLGKKRLSTTEVAERVGVSPRTISSWAAAWNESGGSEGIPGFKMGPKLWKFEPDEIERWIALQKNGTAQEKSAFAAAVTSTRKTGSTG